MRNGDHQGSCGPLSPTVLRGLQHKGSRANRNGHGLSPSTINQYLAAVSSFYQYVTTQHLVPADGDGERPLHRHNPAAVARPSVQAYTRATYLDAQQLATLLRAIPRWTAQGLRDYALLLGYILTGRRNSEWRNLQWGQLGGRQADPIEPRQLDEPWRTIYQRVDPVNVTAMGLESAVWCAVRDLPNPTLRYTTLDEASLGPLSPPGHVDLCARWLLQSLAEAGEPVRPSRTTS